MRVLDEHARGCAGQAVDEALLWDINREATRRMTALVAPQASDVHGPELLRLSMGPLFAQARAAPCLGPLVLGYYIRKLPCEPSEHSSGLYAPSTSACGLL